MPVDTAATFVPKGGVGKTTTTAHIAVATAQEHDRDVCIVDLAGEQNDIARHFGIKEAATDTDGPISGIFESQWWTWQQQTDADPVEVMRFGTDEGVDIIPSDPGLGGADNNLANTPREDRYEFLARFRDEFLADHYDLVLFDLPGKEDNIAINGLVAAQHVIAPLRPGAFERDQLATLESQLETLSDDLVIDTLLDLAAVIPTMIDRRTNQSEQFLTDLEATHADLVTTPVPQTANIGTLQSEGRTLFAVNDDRLYATGREARDAYRDATAHVLEVIANE